MKFNEWRRQERELIARNRLHSSKLVGEKVSPVKKVKKTRVKSQQMTTDKSVVSLVKTVEQKVYDKFKDRPEKYREVVRSLFYRMFKFDNDFRRQVQAECPGVLDD